MKALQVVGVSGGWGWPGWRRRWRRRRPCGSGRWSTPRSIRRSSPGPGWHRVHTRLAGICGSDLSMIEGHASTYFDDWVSFPFVPGHEVVGELDDGTRVVLEPVLGHEARGFRPPFDGAAPGDGDDYAHLATGHLGAGIQTGFCCSTGGGWAPQFVAHESQLHRIGDDVPDERAVLVEPLAGGIHAALKAGAVAAEEPVVAVLGAGTMGLAAIAGLVRYVPEARVVVGARYPHQQRVAARARRPRRRAGRRAGPGRAADRRLPRRRRPSVVRCPCNDRRRRQRALDRRRPRHHPAPRARRDDGHAGRGHPRPDRAVAPRDRARRRLHVRHRVRRAQDVRPGAGDRRRHRGRTLALRHLPPRRPRRRHRPRRRGRPAWRRQDRLRPPTRRP